VADNHPKATIEAVPGIALRGWESPGLTETDETLGLLAEAGIDMSPIAVSMTNWCRQHHLRSLHCRNQ
jgi:hypothetical protein